MAQHQMSERFEPQNPHRTISVDFDGVLHPYTRGWVGNAPDDEPPMEGAREFLVGLIEQGFRIVISTCRADTPAGYRGVWAWLRRHDLARHVDHVTDKKPVAVAYVDDRAVSFRGDWNEVAGEVTRLAAGRVHGAPQR